MWTNIGNYKTTILGFAVGILLYLQTQGAAYPKDMSGWLQLAVSALLAGLGYVAKDASTGSKPFEALRRPTMVEAMIAESAKKEKREQEAP